MLAVLLCGWNFFHAATLNKSSFVFNLQDILMYLVTKQEFRIFSSNASQPWWSMAFKVHKCLALSLVPLSVPQPKPLTERGPFMMFLPDTFFFSSFDECGRPWLISRCGESDGQSAIWQKPSLPLFWFSPTWTHYNTIFYFFLEGFCFTLPSQHIISHSHLYHWCSWLTHSIFVVISLSGSVY